MKKKIINCIYYPTFQPTNDAKRVEFKYAQRA